jgi:SAM-dependent methyltransferase
MTDALEWTGRVGDAWAAEWQRTDRSFADLSRQLDAAILAAAPEGAFRALDIGCGAGGTSLALAGARSDAQITGVDLSEELVRVARSRVPVRFLVGDARVLALEQGPFDLLYSRHGVMFFDDPVAAFAALRAGARAGAQLIFSCFRARGENGWVTAVDDAVGSPGVEPTGYAPGPFGFADEGFVRDVLTEAGWASVASQPIDYRYVAGADVDDAMSFFGRIGPAARALAAADPAERPAIDARLRSALAANQTSAGVTFPAAAWIWTATAGGPA